MARKPKVITNWRGMSEENFATAVDKTNKNLNTNALIFPALAVPVSTQVTLLKEYEIIRLATYYDGQAGDLKNKRKEIQANLTLNGNYINTLANGDMAILEKSGYPMAKDPHAQGPLEQTVLKLGVRNIAGELDYSITGALVDGVRVAIFHTLADDPELNPFTGTFYYTPKRKGVIKYLTSGKPRKCVSVAIGTWQELVVSEVVVKTVL